MIHNSTDKPQADILVVDDVPDNIRLLSTMLVERGYSVRKALSGQMALTAAQIAPPDLILLDINMPEMNGYEVCKRLKESDRTHSIPVIFLSALDDVFDKVKAFQVGGVDFITKPYYFEEVLVRVQTQLIIRNLQLQVQNTNSICSFSNYYIPACDYINKLLNIISIYQREYPNPTPAVKQALEEANLDLIISDLQKLTDNW